MTHDETKQATMSTPGPWKVVGQEYDDVRIETEHPMPPQDHSYGDQTIVGSSEWTFLRDNDARRICAAVNACQGISTEALEQGVIAELLDTLRGCLFALDENSDGGGPTKKTAIMQSRAAIATALGGAA